ncbi:CDP-diacylglycerol--serine O-phosphatidyltransferase [Chiayiivirga flava]|uniref:CDP-diacylglycerol--serine O-phosphatidyltransferase n=1 Tax=Chiayiivirga flava TaxID=659595 RepID=A0A7W8D9M1_9GAMM|nr:CDP-diacylglycerol--serine O-phosphatidyltransferase [Chiayiivirga flava]MBB5208668.1 CDP-diacylglycerol--serine O-phosphatidyltransferase [Chiayiivirga flava]
MDDHQPVRARPARGIYLLPNLLTSGGLFAGFYAIIAASQDRFVDACIAVFVAAILDGLDGRIARLTNTQTEFGTQYDSLADLVSFGMAPALVMYHWSLSTLQFLGPVWGKAGWAAAFLYAACAALRLARFNTQVGVVDKRWFIGLASPAAAATMMSLIWTLHDFGYGGADVRYVALAVTVAAGLLMVSRVRYYSFKTLPFASRVPFVAVLVALLVLVALAVDTPRVLLAIAGVYLLSGPLHWLVRRVRPRGATPAE